MEIDLKRKETVVIIILILAAVFGLGYQLALSPLSNPYEEAIVLDDGTVDAALGETTTKKQEEVAPQVQKMVYVHVTGAVLKPGVYTLLEGARVQDIIKLAQPTLKADPDLLNLAETVTDQQKIVVPRKGEAVQEAKSGQNISSRQQSLTKKNGKININSASVQELDTLPGIGPAYATRIIEYRTSCGGFKSIEELKKVSGIGEQKFSKIKDLITI